MLEGGIVFNLTIDLISKLNKIYKDDTAKVQELCEVLLVNKTIQEPRNKANSVYGNIIINKLIRNEIILKTKLTARNSSGYETYALHPKYEAYMTQILDIQATDVNQRLQTLPQSLLPVEVDLEALRKVDIYIIFFFRTPIEIRFWKNLQIKSLN